MSAPDLTLIPGKRLAAEELDDGSWLVLTREEVAVVGAEGVDWARPWHEVDRGEWDGESHTLTIRWVGGTHDLAVRTAAHEPRQTPLVFRERVEHSVVHTETLSLPEGGTLKAAVRRRSDGSLLTQVLAVGVTNRGPDLDRLAEELETKVRGVVGLT